MPTAPSLKVWAQHTSAGKLTSSLCSFVISLAHQLFVIHQVKLVTSRELPDADEAGETLQVIDIILCPSHHLCGRDWLVAASTSRAKFSVKYIYESGNREKYQFEASNRIITEEKLL